MRKLLTNIFLTTFVLVIINTRYMLVTRFMNQPYRVSINSIRSRGLYFCGKTATIGDTDIASSLLITNLTADADSAHRCHLNVQDTLPM